MNIISTGFRYIKGLLRNDEECAMPVSHGLFFAPSGNPVARFVKGSDDDPLTLPLLSVKKGAVSKILAVLDDGKVVSLIPNDADVAKRLFLTWAAGGFSFQESGQEQTLFDDSEVQLTDPDCNARYVAVFEGCNQDGVLRLKKANLNTLFSECTNTVNDLPLDFLAGCRDGQRGILKPIPGYSLGPVLAEDGSYQWGLVPNTTPTVAVGQKAIFRTTRTIQALVVPSGATKMYVKIWGASGGDNPQNTGTSYGGGGGYTYGEINVTPGQTFGIVVGAKGFYPPSGPCESVVGGGGFLFGGNGGYNGCNFYNGSGGGMSAIINGTSALLPSETSRIVLCAGGGGGAIQKANGAKLNGGGGNVGGGQTTMQGQHGGNSSEGRAGGGGGYAGGNAGNFATSTKANGGTGYAAASVTNSVITAATGVTPANSGDQDFQPQGGNGMIVITFTT